MGHSLEREASGEQSGDWGTASAGESGLPVERKTRARKRSLQLTLVLISAAAMTGCGRLENDGGTSRDVYANLEECRADWGNPEDCEEIDEKRSATGARSFYGPRYTSRTGSYGGYTTTTRPGSRSKGTVSSGSSASRGGFGSSSSRHSSSSYSG
jgi:uncharacterized protein YgiB involved in biofilm formation